MEESPASKEEAKRQRNSTLHWSKLVSFSAFAYKHLSLKLCEH